MKSVMMFSVLLLSSVVSANERGFDLRSSDFSVEAISGEVTSVRPLCPAGMTCFTNGTIVRMSFTLGSCVNRLAPLSFESIEADGVLHVYVSAQEVVSRDAPLVRCLTVEKAVREITLFNRYGQVQVHFLGTGVTAE